MKNFTPIIFLLFISFILSCNTTKQAIKRGEYGLATQLSTTRVQQNHKKYKQIKYLETSFPIANKIDLEKIDFLKKQNIPNNNETIFNLYTIIRERQEAIKPLLPLYNKKAKRNAIFNFTNVDEELIKSKDATIAYFYKKGLDFLNKNNRFDARNAYDMFDKVTNLNPDYNDVQNLKNTAYTNGQNFVFVKMINDARVILPEDFEQKILSITTSDLKNMWTTYDTRKRENINYSHNIIIRLQNIDVSPEKEMQREYTEEDTLEEKVFITDAFGKPKKDSLGNKLFNIVKTKVACKVTELEQRKGANINGLVEFYDRESNQIIHTAPVTSTMLWQNFAAKANGDLRALKKETKEKLGNKPQAFPNNFFILDGASETLKLQIKDVIVKYFELVR